MRTPQSVEVRIVETVAKFRECYRRVEEYEAAHGMRYDNIVRLRPDIFFYAPLDPALFQSAVPLFPNGVHGCYFPCFNNHLAFLPRWAAGAYFNAVEFYEECKGELTIKLQIEKFVQFLNTADLRPTHYARHPNWNQTARTVGVPYSILRRPGLPNCERTSSAWAIDAAGGAAVAALPTDHPFAAAHRALCEANMGAIGDAKLLAQGPTYNLTLVDPASYMTDAETLRHLFHRRPRGRRPGGV